MPHQETPPHHDHPHEVIWRGIVRLTGSSEDVQLTNAPSEALRQVTGYSFEEAASLPGFLTSLAATPEAAASLHEHLQGLQKTHAAALLYPIVTKDGTYATVEMRTQRLRRLDTKRYEVLGAITLKTVGNQKIAPQAPAVPADPEETIRHLAFHDTLTGLPNRIRLTEHLSASLQHAAENEEQVAVLFIDLDGFKTINDTLGHQAGDELLIEVAQRLRRSVREHDLVARFGGDEFVIVIRGADSSDPERIASGILSSLEEYIEVVGREAYVSASIGLAVGPQDGETPDELLRNADNALYRAKDAGRATVQVYNPSMHLISSAKFLMEESLRKAIARNEFFLEYQPIVAAKTGEVISAEALLRWRHPLRDVVLPHEFLTLAEEAGIIEDIGTWMISTAIKQVQSWQAAGYTIPRISINISKRELRQRGFVADLISAFQKAGVSPSQFQLEITEGVAAEQLNKLKEAGFHLSVDEFGRSASSIHQLSQLPFTSVKIDPAFVRTAADNDRDRSVLRSLISLGHSLGLQVCVEGVETTAQRTLLQEWDCDSLQGRAAYSPLSPHEFLTVIASKRP